MLFNTLFLMGGGHWGPRMLPKCCDVTLTRCTNKNVFLHFKTLLKKCISIFLLWQYPLQEAVQRRQMASVPSQCCELNFSTIHACHFTFSLHVPLCVLSVLCSLKCHSQNKKYIDPHSCLCFMSMKMYFIALTCAEETFFRASF